MVPQAWIDMAPPSSSSLSSSSLSPVASDPPEDEVSDGLLPEPELSASSPTRAESLELSVA